MKKVWSSLLSKLTCQIILGSKSFTRWLVLGCYNFIMTNTNNSVDTEKSTKQKFGGVINWKFTVWQVSAEWEPFSHYFIMEMQIFHFHWYLVSAEWEPFFYFFLYGRGKFSKLFQLGLEVTFHVIHSHLFAHCIFECPIHLWKYCFTVTKTHFHVSITSKHVEAYVPG